MGFFLIIVKRRDNKRSYTQKIESDSFSSAMEFAFNKMLLNRFECEIADYGKMGLDFRLQMENLLDEPDHKIYRFNHSLGMVHPVEFFIDIQRKESLPKIDVFVKGSGEFDEI